MPCHCKNIPPCAVIVKSISAGDGMYALETDFTLSTLTANADFALIVCPGEVCDAGNDPVVLSDGATILNLTMLNGNAMREQVFKRLLAKGCNCAKAVHIKCFYGDDPEHVLVWPTDAGRHC